MRIMPSGPLLLALAAVTACAKSEPVPADPDEVEAAVKQAHEEADSMAQNRNSG